MRKGKSNRNPRGLSKNKNFGQRDSGRSSSGGRSRGKSFGGKNFGGRSDRPHMHKVTCDKCGNICEVPFKPTGNKPVLCRDCFDGTSGSSRSNRSNRSSRSEGSNRQLDEINEKLDLIMRALNIDK